MFYPDTKVVTVIPDKCKDYSQISDIKHLVKGGNTIFSMINQGVKSSYCEEWNLVIITQGWIKNGLDIKYSYFINSDKDILFPIISKSVNFVDADVNGMLIKKDSFLDIGDFPDAEGSKLVWASEAMHRNYCFKGVVGARVF